MWNDLNKLEKALIIGVGICILITIAHEIVLRNIPL